MLSGEEKIIELREAGEAIGKLAEDEAAFKRVVEAFRALDAERFQAELARLGLFQRCRLICHWLCSKHCVFVCFKLCGSPTQEQPSIREMREFARVTARIAADEALLKRLVEAVDREDAAAFRELVAQLKLERFCHQLCHWLCFVRCRRICRLMCPPPPLITKVAYIPTSQINALGYGSGPSNPPGTTAADDKPNGVGDHPFGGLANIRGAFNIAGPVQYKVEFATALGGPWTPIVEPVNDYRFNPLWPAPGEPLFIDYMRVPVADWYAVADMGLAGPDYLTDWRTPTVVDHLPVANSLYYLKLTVRNAAMAEFESPLVPVRIDNVLPSPAPPVIELQLQKPDGGRRDLGCCEEVERGDGNLIVIKLQAWDENFSQISVRLLGGCGVSLPIIDTGGTPLSKTYNGNIADTGYPALTEFLWDPWAAGVEPCCYVIYVEIWDRAIVDNFWSGAHHRENWRSITIA